jgi:hypothetical protein
MLSYGTSSEIAAKVFADLNIDDNIYLSWGSDNEVNAFENEYLNEDFIRPLVEAELQNYDTSENTSAEIKNTVDDAVEQVAYSISMLVEHYWDYQNQIILGAYNEIVEVIRNAPIANVNDIDVIYEPADPSVGIYEEERAIVAQLSNGATITFKVEFERD